MKLFNTFTEGAMNKDIELRLIPKNFYLDARNVRITTPDGSNSRSVKFALGNTQMSSLSLGTNAECIGSCVDSFRNKIYWAVVSDSGSYVCEYDVATATENIVLSDTRSGASNLFGFSSGGYVEMRVINDNDNGRNYLVFVDGDNEPKFFEIEAAKGLTDSSFVLEDVSLIKSPPSSAPSLTLGLTSSNQENNLETKFLSFAYRYKYQNGEWSALSPFSEFAFLPDNFSYNYKAGTNNSMFNGFSKVDIDINTGSSNVSDIQLIVKESGSNTAYIVDNYNKSNESWGNNTTETITFDNSRIYQALDSNQLTRVYDNVPITAETLEIIGNRIVFGNYTEGYDLTYSGSDIALSFTLDYVSASGTTGNAHKQVKSNRDYEIAIAYTDGKGRMTTPLVSDGNTIFVPYSVADEKVQLRVTIDSNSRPPDWATGYRFFIKQSKTDYDVLAPLLFYREGTYVWVKLEGSDYKKINEGDFIYVKSDTTGFKDTSIRVKVLSIMERNRNFLETDINVIEGEETLQQEGYYMKLEVDNFVMNPQNIISYSYDGYSFRSSATSNNIVSGSDSHDTYFAQGGWGGSFSYSSTGSDDIRFEIEIDGNGTPDTFRWRKWNVSQDDVVGSWTSGVAITGGSQTLSDGLSISFSSTTGHTIGDKAFVSTKSATRTPDWNEGGGAASEGRRAIMVFKVADSRDFDGIPSGSVITITYDDSASSSETDNKQGYESLNLTSSQDYPNIEEWFYGDNVLSAMGNVVDDINDVIFRRGTVSSSGEIFTVGSTSDAMHMLILSPANYVGSSRVRVNTSISLEYLEYPLLFETIPTDSTTDVFYELPYTYNISGGVHLGDTNQIFGVTDAVVTLDYFNSFGWYNGFESIKIGDTFNEKTMVLDTKPLVPIENYQQIQRIASLTYSDTYEATTQFNALNEFNLAELNYKDMDIRYGAIRKLHARDTDLVVFQHDKTHYVLFNKSVLYNADGSGNVSQSLNVLGQEVAYNGEYGIGAYPESFAFFGNRIYHLDKDRGAMMRLSIDGYTEISQKGMADYFRTLSSQTSFVGGYDPYNDEYLLNVVPDSSPLTLAYKESFGFTSFYEFQPERLVGINNRLYSIKDGQIWLHDSNTTRNNFYGVQRNANITTVFNDSPTDVKHFKSVNLESDIVWDITLTTNFGNSTIADTELVLEEKEYYGYIRQSESTNFADLASDSAVSGIGEISSINTLTLTIDGELPRALAVGDTIYDDSGSSVGVVQSYSRVNNTITLDSVGSLIVTDFIMFGKTARIEGESMKGYYIKVQLDSDSSGDNELFAVKVEAVRSSD